MANREHVGKLKKGVQEWNAWRRGNKISPNLNHANLSGMDLSGVDLHFAKLHGTNFQKTDLSSADLSYAQIFTTNMTFAKLGGANFNGSALISASLHGAVMKNADFTSAHLHYTSLLKADMRGANFSFALFNDVIFSDVDLSQVVGLATCRHIGPSTIDLRTFVKSGPLPIPFLRGIGLSDGLIKYLPSLFGQAILHYSCFISYSSNDQDLADRIYADLQDKGVRCWLALHDMPIGDKILDTIDEAIRLRDKVLLVLSEDSIKSDWVEDEVTKAFEEERKRGKTILFPIRLDDAVMETNEPWAAKLRNRHIGDFRRWKEHDEYQKSFARVLRALTVKKP